MFVSQWIKPEEYSFCGQCGRYETLMRGSYKIRPKCVFCNTLNVTPIKVSWIKWLFNKKYRIETIKTNKDIDIVTRKRQQRIDNAHKLHKERNELAKHRKETLKLEPAFWM